MREIGTEQGVRNFGKVQDAVEIPDLVAVQRKSYDRFLQKDVAPTKRKCSGLEAIFRETFPIESYDKKVQVRGFVIKELSPIVSSFRADKSLSLLFPVGAEAGCCCDNRIYNACGYCEALLPHS